MSSQLGIDKNVMTAKPKKTKGCGSLACSDVSKDSSVVKILHHIGRRGAQSKTATAEIFRRLL